MAFRTAEESRAYAKGRRDERMIRPTSVMTNGGNPAASGQIVGAKQDQRFRSFAERWVVTRSHLFRQDPQGLAEDMWACTLDAKRAYGMIRQVSIGVGRQFDDGNF